MSKQSNEVKQIKPSVISILGTGRLIGGSELSSKAARARVYRLAKQGELEIVKVGLRSSAVTRTSIERFAAARGITVDF